MNRYNFTSGVISPVAGYYNLILRDGEKTVYSATVDTAEAQRIIKSHPDKVSLVESVFTEPIPESPIEAEKAERNPDRLTVGELIDSLQGMNRSAAVEIMVSQYSGGHFYLNLKSDMYDVCARDTGGDGRRIRLYSSLPYDDKEYQRLTVRKMK